MISWWIKDLWVTKVMYCYLLKTPPVVQPKSSCDVHLLRSPCPSQPKVVFLPIQALSFQKSSILKQISVAKIQIISFREEKCLSVWSYDKNIIIFLQNGSFAGMKYCINIILSNLFLTWKKQNHEVTNSRIDYKSNNETMSWTSQKMCTIWNPLKSRFELYKSNLLSMIYLLQTTNYTTYVSKTCKDAQSIRTKILLFIRKLQK